MVFGTDLPPIQSQNEAAIIIQADEQEQTGQNYIIEHYISKSSSGSLAEIISNNSKNSSSDNTAERGKTETEEAEKLEKEKKDFEAKYSQAQIEDKFGKIIRGAMRKKRKENKSTPKQDDELTSTKPSKFSGHAGAKLQGTTGTISQAVLDIFGDGSYKFNNNITAMLKLKASTLTGDYKHQLERQNYNIGDFLDATLEPTVLFQIGDFEISVGVPIHYMSMKPSESNGASTHNLLKEKNLEIGPIVGAKYKDGNMEIGGFIKYIQSVGDAVSYFSIGGEETGLNMNSLNIGAYFNEVIKDINLQAQAKFDSKKQAGETSVKETRFDINADWLVEHLGEQKTWDLIAGLHTFYKNVSNGGDANESYGVIPSIAVMYKPKGENYTLMFKLGLCGEFAEGQDIYTVSLGAEVKFGSSENKK